MEAQKSIKRYQGQLREAECGYEEEQRARQNMMEKVSLSERRANALQGEMEEARSLLESAERGKRQTEAELSEARVAVNEMTSIGKLQKEKKGCGENRQKTEEDVQAMEDRCNHLGKVKGKLEQSLDECEDTLEREKKSKGDVE